MNKTQQKIYTQAKGKWDAIAKPIDSLGVFEDMVARLCAIAGTVNPGDYKRRALLTLCADHGVVAEGVTQTDASVTKVVAENIAHGCSGVNYMAQMAGVDVYAVDIGMRGEAYPDATFGMGHMINRKVQAGTGNLAKEPAMSMEICDRAIEAGKELVRECKEKGYEILAVGEMGIGNTTPTSALLAALLDLPADTVTGRGAGLNNAGLARKVQVITQALARVQGTTDAKQLLAALGGLEIAGMVGVFLGARQYSGRAGWCDHLCGGARCDADGCRDRRLSSDIACVGGSEWQAGTGRAWTSGSDSWQNVSGRRQRSDDVISTFGYGIFHL